MPATAPSALVTLPAASDGTRTIVHLAAEYAPFARTGGLAEAVKGLATFQWRAGDNVVVFVPMYRSVRELAPDLAPIGRPVAVDLGYRTTDVRFFREVRATPGPRVVFVDAPAYFNRAGLYGEHGADYADNARRFALFSRAALEGIQRFITGPLLIHAHDWHTALTLLYVRRYEALQQRFRGTPLVLSVHNAGYQGHFAPSVLSECGIPLEDFTWQLAEWHGRVNFLKTGLQLADMVVTVSPGHARELRTADGGFGLHGVFQWLGDRFVGITNGIDQSEWNPATDVQITANYTSDELDAKARCKAALQRTFGLPQRKRVPLFGMTGRMVTQKGLDLILQSHLVWNMDAQFVFLGKGEPRYEDALNRLASARPRHVGVQLDFTDRLEHRLMAGADMFLMPSQYEPCGLTQMRAQRYGALPIGRRVGGIADTVEDDVTGFLFDSFTPGAFDHAISRALARFADEPSWTARLRTAMARDFGWERSAERYAAAYAHAERQAAQRGGTGR